MTDTPHNPFADMMRMGQEWAKALNPALEHFTPKGFEAVPILTAQEWRALQNICD